MDRDDIFREAGDRLPIALPSGTLLRDQFRIGRVLGAGGFGVTYLGFDELLERPVAVKEYFPRHLAVDRTDTNSVVPRSSAQDPDFDFGLQRFLQEARTLAKFEDHPNIVRVRTFFGENGTGYLVMNFYEGYTLEEYIEAQSGWLPEEEALYIIHDVLDGLQAAHDAGVLHRDIDPSNIYLTEDGRVVLLDFGAARAAVGERTQTLSVMLKRGYAPHEQYHSRGEQGPWTDIYASAATLYRTLTGYKPPEAPARVMNEDLVPPIEISPSLSHQVNDAVVAGLKVLPQNRPQSIEAFRDLLPPPPGITAAAWIDGNPRPHDHDPYPGDLGEAVVEVRTDADCRLYVNGRVSEILEAGQTVMLNLSRGSHRLRAVRTDRAASSGGTATLTTTATSTGGGHSDYVSLHDLIWQSEISASPDSPTAVHVTFDTEGLELPDPDRSASFRSRTSGAGTFSSGASDDDAKSSPASKTATQDAVPAGSSDEEGGARVSRAASTGASPAKQSDDAPAEGNRSGERARRRRRADPVEDTGVVSKGSRSPAVGQEEATAQSDIAVALHHASRAAKKAGRRALDGATHVLSRTRRVTTTTARTMARRIKQVEYPDFLVRPSKNGTTGETEQATAPDSEDDRPGSGSMRAITDRVSTRALQVGGAALVALFLIIGGWWAFLGSGAPAQPTNQPPVAGDDLATTQTDVVTINVTANDEDPEGGSVRLASVTALPGSIGAVSQLDSARIQYRPAEGFSGVAEIHHTVMDPDSNFASSVARIHVPFAGEPARVFVAPRDPQMLAPADVDGDGTLDLLTATYAGHRVLLFSLNRDEPVVVMDGAEGAIDASAADMDSDGDMDVLAAAFRDDAVYVIQNVSSDGELAFSEPIAMPGEVKGALLAQPADVNGDGQLDVVAVSRIDGEIVWFENRSASGGFKFAEAQPIANSFGGLEAVIVADVDGDGDPDVGSADYRDDTVAWHENTGDGTFTTHIVDDAATGVIAVAAADVDGDGLRDMLASTATNDRVVWYRQIPRDSTDTGPATFGEAQLVSDSVNEPESIAVADVDHDGDNDVLSASFRSGIVAWHENLGEGTFGARHIITRSAPEALAVLPVDLDGDGDVDIAAASQGNDRITWFENAIRSVRPSTEPAASDTTDSTATEATSPEEPES
ncbi:MAG: protein kinase [Bacteroidetes bacterium]|jgi:serine/threonine protein kinase|nr:protein kinase [Bacteroidota bacterium]